jgi:predicted nucleic acid-binding protein
MAGLILDSSLVIKAERQKLAIPSLLRAIQSIAPGDDVGLSATGVTELFHGIYRADTALSATNRRTFLRVLLDPLPVFKFTLQVATIAGRFDGEEAGHGSTIPCSDLLTGATALSLNSAVLTSTLRDFRKIPTLAVIPF